MFLSRYFSKKKKKKNFTKMYEIWFLFFKRRICKHCNGFNGRKCIMNLLPFESGDLGNAKHFGNLTNRSSY